MKKRVIENILETPHKSEEIKEIIKKNLTYTKFVFIEKFIKEDGE